MCVCVCIYQIAHKRAIRPCHPSYSMPLAGRINDNTCYENLWSGATEGTHSLYLYNSYLSLCVCVYVCPSHQPIGAWAGNFQNQTTAESEDGACTSSLRKYSTTVEYSRVLAVYSCERQLYAFEFCYRCNSWQYCNCFESDPTSTSHFPIPRMHQAMNGPRK